MLLERRGLRVTAKEIRWLGCLFAAGLIAVSWGADPAPACRADLEDVVGFLRRTPSFKDQIRGEARRSFAQYVERTRRAIDDDPLIELHCRVHLQRVVRQVRDRHLGVVLAARGPDPEDTQSVERVVDSGVIDRAPRLSDDVEAWTKRAAASDDPAAGVYLSRSGKRFAFGPAPRTSSSTWVGVVLEDDLPLWRRGDIRTRVSTDADGVEGTVYAWNRQARSTWAVDTAQLLESWGWRRPGAPRPAHRGLRHETDHRFEMIEDVAYLYLGTFRGSSENIRAIETVYDQAFPELRAADTWLLDVRDNGGGGERTFIGLLEFLDDLPAQPELHLLMNRNTASAAEHFVLELIERGATTYGESTRGAINYRYRNRAGGKPRITSSRRYRFVGTVARNKEYFDLRRETRGISPSIALVADRDWREQLLERLHADPAPD